MSKLLKRRHLRLADSGGSMEDSGYPSLARISEAVSDLGYTDYLGEKDILAIHEFVSTTDKQKNASFIPETSIRELGVNVSWAVDCDSSRNVWNLDFNPEWEMPSITPEGIMDAVVEGVLSYDVLCHLGWIQPPRVVQGSTNKRMAYFARKRLGFQDYEEFHKEDFINTNTDLVNVIAEREDGVLLELLAKELRAVDIHSSPLLQQLQRGFIERSNLDEVNQDDGSEINDEQIRLACYYDTLINQVKILAEVRKHQRENRPVNAAKYILGIN